MNSSIDFNCKIGYVNKKRDIIISIKSFSCYIITLNEDRLITVDIYPKTFFSILPLTEGDLLIKFNLKNPEKLTNLFENNKHNQAYLLSLFYYIYSLFPLVEIDNKRNQ